ncbi:hypothetical protein T484DRAFT_1861096 [Baffinella frigidus]|nr:hypothetical protein T484DRAFT_1861096 [Cryptophyta sp. CCMP2293]
MKSQKAARALPERLRELLSILDAARALLHGGADVNARTVKGNTPLLFACNAGHTETAKGGADVNAQTVKGNTPLLFACNAGHTETAKGLGSFH